MVQVSEEDRDFIIFYNCRRLKVLVSSNTEVINLLLCSYLCKNMFLKKRLETVSLARQRDEVVNCHADQGNNIFYLILL